MRVDQNGVAGLPEVAANDGRPANRARRATPTSVVVSAGVRAHHEQQRAADAARAEHVQSIKARIERGAYSVDFGKLAQRMLDDDAGRG